MILTLNVGNTYTSIGFAGEGGIGYSSMLPTYHTETAHGYAIKIKQLFDITEITPDMIEGAIISSVVPSLTATVRDAVKLICKTEPLIVGAGVKTGLHIATDDPGTVASDLVANSVAAKEEYPLPAVVVDMGTATTVMALDGTGRYIGGAILPGAGISLEALKEKASLLPRVDISAPKKAISASTSECMRSGIIYGGAGAVDGVLSRFEDELGTELKSIILTGELATAFAPYIKHRVIYDEDLTLKGLAVIYKKNKR